MDPVWDTSKYPPKMFVTLCQIKVIQGHKVKCKILSLGGVIHAFRSDFRQERKNYPGTLFELFKSDKTGKSKKCRNPRKSHKE